jgi:uncharacterized small protein (DUF1192 family)
MSQIVNVCPRCANTHNCPIDCGPSMTPIPPIPEDLREFSRRIVSRVAHDTASILHTRHSLGDADDCYEGIAESDFCDEAEALATGEECGCLDPEEAIAFSLMTWVANEIAERIAKLTAANEELKAENTRLKEDLAAWKRGANAMTGYATRTPQTNERNSPKT